MELFVDVDIIYSLLYEILKILKLCCFTWRVVLLMIPVVFCVDGDSCDVFLMFFVICCVADDPRSLSYTYDPDVVLCFK